jgi:hypothetical protein
MVGRPESEVESLLGSDPRARLIAAIAELCCERGFEEISLELLLARGQCSKEEFEELFSSKEHCATEAVKAILGEVMGVMSGVYSPDRSDWDNGMYGVAAIIELMAAKPSFANLSYIGARQTLPGESHAVYLAGVEVLCAMMDGLRRMRPHSPPRTSARAAFGAAEALIRREISAGRASEIERLLPDLIYGATVPFLGQTDALWMSRRARGLAHRGAGHPRWHSVSRREDPRER